MTKLMSKPDLKDIAEKLHSKDLSSNYKHIEDRIYEAIINRLDRQLEAWTEEVIEIMQELEHPEPRTKAEYDERYGLDKE